MFDDQPKLRQQTVRSYNRTDPYKGDTVRGDSFVQEFLRLYELGDYFVCVSQVELRIVRPSYNEYAHIVCAPGKRASVFSIQDRQRLADQWYKEGLSIVIGTFEIRDVSWENIGFLVDKVGPNAEAITYLAKCDTLTVNERVSLAIDARASKSNLLSRFAE